MPAAILQRVVSSGQPAPVGGTFDSLEIAGQAIPAPNNRRGEVAFFASLVRSPADEGLFVSIGDRIGKLAAMGDVMPGGEHIADFTDRPGLALNEGGAAAFVATLAGGTLTAFGWPVLDDAGNVAFLASVRRSRGSSDAILAHRDGELRKLVAAGDDAPGGGVFSALGAPAMNNRGVVAFAAIVEQGPVLGGLYILEDGRTHLALAAGTPAPNGGVFAKFSEQVAINDAGTIAFSAVLRHGGPATAVFVLDGDVARPIAATGDPAPDGGIFAAFPSWPVLNQRGTVGFVASLDSGASPLAIYIAQSSRLKRLAGIGDALPDGGRLAAFPRYPAVAIGPDDAVTFAAAAEREGRQTDMLFYDGPARH